MLGGLGNLLGGVGKITGSLGKITGAINLGGKYIHTNPITIYPENFFFKWKTRKGIKTNQGRQAKIVQESQATEQQKSK